MAYMGDANCMESKLTFQLTKKAKGKMLIFRKVEKREIVTTNIPVHKTSLAVDETVKILQDAQDPLDMEE